jgi:hypothetical protein
VAALKIEKKVMDDEGISGYLDCESRDRTNRLLAQGQGLKDQLKMLEPRIMKEQAGISK